MSSARSNYSPTQVRPTTLRIPEDEACTIFQQIIGGIEYIHKLNIVHRDLKPENLLIDYDRSIRLVDFGLSNTYRKGNAGIIQRNDSRLPVDHPVTPHQR